MGNRDANSETPRIAAFATKGTGTNDEKRLQQLLIEHAVTFVPYDRSAKRKSFISLLRWLFVHRPDLLVMEGTGVAGGVACILAKLLHGQRYVVSSGDAVSPFVGSVVPVLRPLFAVYERLLCWCSSGFIGWTPYLTGRALTFGAPRAMTAAGWSDHVTRPDTRSSVRAALGISDDVIVIGIVGTLTWNRRYGYCYGWELVQAALRLQRRDVRVLIIGGGSGLAHLRSLAGDQLGQRILLPGAVRADTAVDYMSAMDVGSLPQSLDGVGMFRYTTKLSEYLAARLPVVTGQIPLAYDLDTGWLWRLPGATPWSKQYVIALANLIEQITPAQIATRRNAIPRESIEFARLRQTRAVTSFINDILGVEPCLNEPATLPPANDVNAKGPHVLL